MQGFEDMFKEFFGNDIPGEEEAKQKSKDQAGMIKKVAKFLKEGVFPYMRYYDGEVAIEDNELVLTCFNFKRSGEVMIRRITLKRKKYRRKDNGEIYHSWVHNRTIMEHNLSQYVDKTIEFDGDIEQVVRYFNGQQQGLPSASDK